MYRPFFKIVQNSSTKKGFTLIETLVAISILMLAVTGPLVISQKGLSAAAYAKDQMIAYYLAQDAMEYVRNVRDTNAVSGVGTAIGADWLSFLINGSLSACIGGTCKVDTSPPPFFTNIPTACLAPGCLITKTVNGDEVRYSHDSGGTPTPFSRTVKIETPSGGVISDINTLGVEARVTVTVSWSTLSGQTRDVKIVENLFKLN